MANPNELIGRIEELNKQVAQLNAERQKQLGMLESTKKQFETYVANYEQAYGVKLTAENIATEYKSVMTTCQGAADELEKQITYITSGAYKQAVAQSTPIVESVTRTQPIPTGTGFAGFATEPNDLPFDPDPVPVVAPTSAPVQNVAPAPVPVAQTSQPVMMQGFGTNSGVTAQPTFGAQGVPVVKNAVPVVTDDEANKEKPIAPVGWGASANAGNSVDVQGLLSGQFGAKFGG